MGSRIVLDTNVLVSALGWRGPSMTIVRQCVEKKHQLLLSTAILEELERVLAYPKLNFSENEISEYLELLSEAAELFEPAFELSVVEQDPSDNRILECALAGGADAIISGDRHLKVLGSFREIPIFPPSEFLNLKTETPQR